MLKFRKEKEYITSRLQKANLQISPKDIYRNLFANGLDSLRFLKNKKVAIKFENLNLTENEKNPIVFISIHSGAFEILHRVIGTQPTNLIVSEFRNKKLDKFLTNTRQTQNLKIVKDYELSKILKNAIRNKENLAVMADQSKHGGENFDILGDSIPLFFKLPLMANRLGASLVFFRTFKKNAEHVIRFERVYKPKSEIDKNEIAKMIESWVLEHPEQWAWNYRGD
ncbi:MAG: lysophospholipid acyltransferase family protein [Fibromonadaceae bacterium]|nr:lysophospholipid acyltransferase family protein [Fibromonadaceae bacterium]